MKINKPEIKKLQDDDGHWYWIPNEFVKEFEEHEEFLCGKSYMDCPDEFDDFIEKWDKYRTHGHPDNVPDIFKS
ncbi:hypothetical protein ACMGDK_11455 [Chryseobacterium sp. DT-3]|uniref:hypothetical protein n=1 Tax=Chryseobacterium sp. DT-3 TaxID=3396164 RepID=UPI003F1D7A35